jgi:hypothetical protein
LKLGMRLAQAAGQSRPGSFKHTSLLENWRREMVVLFMADSGFVIGLAIMRSGNLIQSARPYQ